MAQLMQDAQAAANKNDRGTAIKHYRQALEIKRTLVDANDPELSNMLHTIGGWYYNSGNYLQAIASFRESLKIRKANYGEVHPEIGKSLNNLGLCHDAIRDFSSAVKYYEESLRVKVLSGEATPASISATYFNMGNSYFFNEDFDRAIQYQSICLAMRLQFMKGNDPRIASVNNSLGVIHFRLEKPDQALEFFFKALKIWEENKKESRDHIQGLMDNIGNCYLIKKMFPEALDYFQRSAGEAKANFGERSLGTARAYYNLGKCYREMHQFDDALEAFRKCLDLRIAFLGNRHPDVESTFYSIALLYQRMDSVDQALRFYDLAFEAAKPKYAESKGYDQMLVNAWADRGHFLLAQYEKTSDASWLTRALESYKRSNEYLQLFREDQSYLSSKIRIAGGAVPVFENHLRTCLLLGEKGMLPDYKARAFDIAEQSKALALFEAMKESEALKTGGIPQSLLDEENRLRFDIAFLERTKHEQLDAGLDPAGPEALALNTQILESQEALWALKDRFEKEYPGYSKLRYDIATVSLDTVQRELLESGQTLLSYMVGDKNIFLFIIQPKKTEVLTIARDFPLERWVTQFRDGIKVYREARTQPPDLLAEGRRQYIEAARVLYDTLFAPAVPYLSDTASLIIVPDGILGLVPFEALLPAAPSKSINFKTYPFLLNEYDITYAYSATLLREMLEHKNAPAPPGTVLAMAPFAKGGKESQQDSLEENARKYLQNASLPDTFWERSGDEKLGPLKYSGDEAFSVARLWEGDFFGGDDATLDRFVQDAGHYRILHLSTHGKADNEGGDYSFLAFSDSRDTGKVAKLYVRDIYNLSLSAELVVLSACETGEGKLERGEGIISLARAFTYAGARSLVTSLWGVDDEATKDLMKYFHLYLRQGKTKDDALRAAKRKVIDDSPRSQHPYYWAGFIGIGDMGAVGVNWK